MQVEKAMAPHCSTLAWKIPWAEEPRGLQSIGSLRLEHDERLDFQFSLSCIGEGNDNPLQCSCLENPKTGEPGGLPSMGSHRVGHDWGDLAAAAAGGGGLMKIIITVTVLAKMWRNRHLCIPLVDM